MSWTKREIIRQAFSEIGLAPHSYSISAEEYQDALRILDNMVSEWVSDGIVFDPPYPLYDNPADSDIDESTNAPQHGNITLYCMLAGRVSSGYGKVLPNETRRQGAAGYSRLARSIPVPTIQMKGMARGSGAKLPLYPFIGEAE